MTTLSIHVLDTAHGRPAAAMRFKLWYEGQLLHDGETGEDGRCNALKAVAHFEPGSYLLEFRVAEYFRAQGIDLPEPPFFNEITIEFGVAESEPHYHVPLLVSPYGYSTYRGS